MSSNELFPDIAVIGSLAPEEAAMRLREIGDDFADEVDNARLLQPQGAAQQYGLLETLGLKPRAWQHTSHVFGYLKPGGPSGDLQGIQHAGNIEADQTLRGKRLRLTLGAIRVADYPGSGVHKILFDFYGQTQSLGTSNHLHYNAMLRIQEGDDAAIIGYPIFIGLGVGNDGVSFGCLTVNVSNEEDEKFLSFLESDVFKAGLKLLETAQPAIAPFSATAESITKRIATRHRNIPVQNFMMGLDFSSERLGARLAEGSFIAMQVPSAVQRSWNWSDLAFNPQNGQIVFRDQADLEIPYNYVVFNVSRYTE